MASAKSKEICGVVAVSTVNCVFHLCPGYWSFRLYFGTKSDSQFGAFSTRISHIHICVCVCALHLTAIARAHLRVVAASVLLAAGVEEMPKIVL